MRTYLHSPFSPLGMGFDPFTNIFAPTGGADAGPRHDIQRRDDEHYRVALAVPGYTDADLEITQDADELVVTGKAREDDESVTILQRGIDRRGFESRFRLGEHVKVAGARLDAGILWVDLNREIPEELRPRTIVIGSGGAPRIDAQAA
jgi:molecular chaperone IbpA